MPHIQAGDWLIAETVCKGCVVDFFLVEYIYVSTQL